jgi:hypothetical protein
LAKTLNIKIVIEEPQSIARWRSELASKDKLGVGLNGQNMDCTQPGNSSMLDGTTLHRRRAAIADGTLRERF